MFHSISTLWVNMNTTTNTANSLIIEVAHRAHYFAIHGHAHTKEKCINYMMEPYLLHASLSAEIREALHKRYGR
jgi:hypothetical protein